MEPTAARKEAGTRTISRRHALQIALGAAIPAFGTLAGCSSGGGGALGGGGGGGKVTELVIPTHRSPWLNAYKEIAASYEAESGIRINLREFPYDGLRTQMVNAMQSNSGAFDIFQIDEPWTAQFFTQKWVTPLKKIDSSFTPDDQIISYSNLVRWDATSKTSSANGDVMGLPLNGNVHILMYRKDLYDQLGLKVPATWEDAYANGRKAQQAGVVKYGHAARGQASSGGQSITYDFMPVFYSYGGSWFRDEGKDWTPTVNTDSAVAAVEMYRRLLQLGPAQPQTLGQAEVVSSMQSGDLLQVHSVVASAPQMEDAKASRVAGKMGYAVVPAGPAGAPAPTSGTWVLSVPSGLSAERSKAASDFIKWMLSVDTQRKFTLGTGIPTRKDVYTASEVPAAMRSYLDPVADSFPNARPAVRYEFASPMLEVVEKSLSAIVSNDDPVKPALDKLNQEITDVVRKAGYLK
ncbi:extracellular solute-binding protein [Arthrobacter sp. LFS091]|uniref:extracellular solute-binding protein n=1 Tax=Arthrobacter sp. LFS091 TaxID=3229892 RepID=UPI003A81191E